MPQRRWTRGPPAPSRAARAPAFTWSPAKGLLLPGSGGSSALVGKLDLRRCSPMHRAQRLSWRLWRRKTFCSARPQACGGAGSLPCSPPRRASAALSAPIAPQELDAGPYSGPLPRPARNPAPENPGTARGARQLAARCPLGPLGWSTAASAEIDKRHSCLFTLNPHRPTCCLLETPLRELVLGLNLAISPLRTAGPAGGSALVSPCCWPLRLSAPGARKEFQNLFARCAPGREPAQPWPERGRLNRLSGVGERLFGNLLLRPSRAPNA